MLTVILRILFYVTFFFILRWLFRFLVQGHPKGFHPRFRRAGNPPGSGAVRGTVVRDPVCGTYVDRSLAKVYGRGENAVYFCSDRCQGTYLKEHH